MRRFAAWPLSRFPTSGFSAQISSNVPSSNAVSLRSLISTPAMFQVPFSPGSVNSTRRKPSLQTRPPEAAGQFAPSVRLRCKRRGHLPFRRQDLPGALLVLAPGTAPAGGAGRRWGRSAIRRNSAARLRRVHSARTRHATAQTPCHAGCFALRSQDRMRTFFVPKPAGWWGLRNKKCSRSDFSFLLSFYLWRKAMCGASSEFRTDHNLWRTNRDDEYTDITDFALSQDSVLRKTANLKEGTNWRGRAHSGAALFMFLPGASRSLRRSWAGVRASLLNITVGKI